MRVARSSRDKGEKEAPPQHLATEPESAESLRVSVSVFRRWVAMGLIHPVVLPGNIRRNLYRISDVAAFAASLPTDEGPRNGQG